MSSLRSGSRRRQRGGSDNARWLTTYGDAMTLLLAFFVMLYVMSEVDAHKFEAFIRGLEVPFGNPAVEDGLLPRSDGIVGDVDHQVEPQPESVHIASDLPQPPALADEGEDEPDDDEAEDVEPDSEAQPTPESFEADRDLDQLRQVREQLQSSLRESGFEQAADYRIDERGLVVSISADDILFELGSTRIGSEGRELVASVAQVLEGYPNDVIVEGHTDDVPLRRADYSNWNLSTDRAVAVLSMLYEDFDFDEGRLGAAGYGEWRPRKPNDTPANRAMNRRVDILVVAQGVT